MCGGGGEEGRESSCSQKCAISDYVCTLCTLLFPIPLVMMRTFCIHRSTEMALVLASASEEGPNTTPPLCILRMAPGGGGGGAAEREGRQRVSTPPPSACVLFAPPSCGCVLAGGG